jgi:hypothetical protein
MDVNSMDNERSPGAPRTATVVVFLAAFAVMVSWLAVYAVTNALIATNVMSAWPEGVDPRPRWMLNAFGGFFGAFAVIALLFGWLSQRQLKRIDEIAEGNDE